MFGKISVGIDAMLKTPRIRIRKAKTTKVYGRRNASRTIHIIGLFLAPAGETAPRSYSYLPIHPDGIPCRYGSSRILSKDLRTEDFSLFAEFAWLDQKPTTSEMRNGHESLTQS
jgi:hypothetical protein